MAFSSDSVQVFLAVLDYGSFSAAARALGRVPSAVSMAVGHTWRPNLMCCCSSAWAASPAPRQRRAR